MKTKQESIDLLIMLGSTKEEIDLIKKEHEYTDNIFKEMDFLNSLAEKRIKAGECGEEVDLILNASKHLSDLFKMVRKNDSNN